MNSQWIAASRFGLRARPDEAAPPDPKAWLRGQLTRFDPKPAALASAPSRSEVAGQLAEYLEEQRSAPRRAQPQQAQRMQPAGMTTGGEAAMNGRLAGLPQSAQQFIRKAGREYYTGAVGARANAALVTEAPFVERLV